jgi:Tol biopolymer transport system component
VAGACSSSSRRADRVLRLALVAAVVLVAGGCSGGDDLGAVGELVIARSGGVYAIDLESGNDRKIGSRARYEGAWSPSGTKVATHRGGKVVVTTVETGATERFDAAFCGLPVWAPEETAVVCEWDDPWVISTLDIETGEWRTLTDPSDIGQAPEWSPDSRSIAYGALVVMRRDGSDRRTLFGGGGAQYGEGPAWSPNGRRIAYLGEGDGVWLVSPEGRDRRRLLGGGVVSRGLAWSPDGRYLAMTRGDGEDFEIFVVEVPGGEARNVTDNSRVNDQWPVWSPDGRHVAYVVDGDDGPGVMVAPVDDGAPRRVFDGAATILHWSSAPG